MEDGRIVELYWEQKEEAIRETSLKYGRLCARWAGQYAVEKNGQNYVVYPSRMREAVGEGTYLLDGGILFTIVCYEEAMTEAQFIENGLDFTAYRYFLATSR